MTREPPARDDVVIRALRGHDEYQACLALQRETWGDAPGTLVPTPLLIVAQRLGGIAAGAFDERGQLLGFVFGLTGIESGRVVHWSDMLAVRPELRDRGLGRRLKAYQREQVARIGARVIYWTYDPLVAKNAWLNLMVLGARIHEYVVDMYGDTGSPMHAGLGTDRIIVAWDVPAGDERPREERPTAIGEQATARDRDQLTALLNPAGHTFATPAGCPARVGIDVPADIFAVRERSGEEARAWRHSSREAFRWSLSNGYRFERVERPEGENVARYAFRRDAAGSTR